VTGPRKTFWTATDLLTTDFPEPRWAVPGVLAEGVNLLAGQPKVGKSWAALNIAVAVASGGKAFGLIDVDLGDVLYLALEDPPRRLADRLRKVLGQDATPAGLNFVTASPPITEGGLDHLGAWLTGHPDGRLVIIDVFARIRGRGDATASAYDVDYTAMAALKTLADRHGIAVLVVHHSRKAPDGDFLNEVSGTNGLAGAADAVLVLKRMRGSADAELHVTGRDVDEAAYALSFAADLGAWQMLAGPASDYTLGDTRQAILRHLRTVEAATPKQIATALKMNYETVKKTCKRMADDGQLDTDGQGTYFTPLSPVPPVPPVPHASDLNDSGGSEENDGDRDTRDARDSPHEGADVLSLCGHPRSATNTANGRCGLCILAAITDPKETA
jgi:hypothetical protein